MAPKATTNETNLDQGGGQGVPENQRKYEEKKNANVKNPQKEKLVFWNVVRFSQKSEASTAGRLLRFYEQMW